MVTFKNWIGLETPIIIYNLAYYYRTPYSMLIRDKISHTFDNKHITENTCIASTKEKRTLKVDLRKIANSGYRLVAYSSEMVRAP